MSLNQVRKAWVLNIRYPGLKAGEVRTIQDTKHEYLVKSDGYIGFELISKIKI